MIRDVEIRKIDLNSSSAPSSQVRSRLQRKNGSAAVSDISSMSSVTSNSVLNSDSLDRGSITLPRRFPKGKTGKILAVALAIFIILFILIIFPLKRTYSSAQATYKQAKIAWTAVKTQKIDEGITDLDQTRVALLQTQKDLSGLAFTRFIPILGWYYSDADHLVKAGFKGIDAAKTVLESIAPYSDVLGLKGKGNFVALPADQRIQLAVTTMGKITPQIDAVAKSFEEAKVEIDQINPNHFPRIFALAKVHDQLVAAKTAADEGTIFVNQARPLIKILPSLLGDPDQKKYLIIFQNDKELRPTGGFMTAYAIFRVERGIIHVDQASDMYNLDNQVPNHPKAPEAILKYLPKVYTLNLRDSNLSPDFNQSMKTFMSLYNTIPGKSNVDGIIALDTHALVSTIKILDDQVYADGILFTSKTDKRCDCPQAIYELESIADTPHSYDLRISNVAAINASRKDIIGSLLFAIMDKAFKSSPKKYWGPLVQSMLTETSQKHVQFDLFNQDAQSGIEALNAGGRIKSFDGDYLHINDTNFGGDKANLFTSEAVEQDYAVGSDGTIQKTITVKYKNPYQPSDCNLERGNLCLNGDYRDWVRFYVPKGSTLTDSRGSEVKVTTSTDLDKTVFEGFLTVRPLGAATFTISYKLPFKVSSKTMPLLVQKQGGTDGHEYTVKVNGHQVEKFNLTEDKTLKLSL